METNQTPETITSSNMELLGAVDIVDAFTSLRHELKLQVRGGRELQQSLQDSLQRLEQRAVATPAVSNTASSPETRKMAEAIADIEESLQRAIESIIQRPATVRSQSNVLSKYDVFLSRAPWFARVFASRWFEDLRAEIAHALESERKASTHDATHRGLELLAARVHRLMKQFEIERVNVLHQAFDADTMNAIDVIVDPSVPSSHVAQQLRPLYRWRNSTLRCAEVRIAS